MAEYIERSPNSEQVVIERERDHYHDEPRSNSGSNAGLIAAIIVIALIVLFLLFGRGLFGGGSSGGTTDVNIQAPTSAPMAQ